MPNPRTMLEVCIASVQDAQAAVAGGADRLELNTALELGGLTPSVGLFDEVKQVVDVPIIVMLRPRAAGFCYDSADLRVMLRDADCLIERGADGIAFGVLDSEGRINRDVCRRFVECAATRETVFHRAFDVVRDPFEAMHDLIELGVSRVMTSGQKESALAGIELITQLQRQFGDRIELLPAAGVRSENVEHLLRHTLCHQLHGSFRTSCLDRAQPVAANQFGVTDRAAVAAARRRM